MMISAVFGRRIHIAGSLPEEAVAGTAEAERARQFVQQLVKELMKKGATFESDVHFVYDVILNLHGEKTQVIRPLRL